MNILNKANVFYQENLHQVLESMNEEEKIQIERAPKRQLKQYIKSCEASGIFERSYNQEDINYLLSVLNMQL